MFDNIINGCGCILAHEMGLGKTLQTISLCDILLRQVEYKQILCVVPVNTLHNWENEFNKWLPTLNSQLYVFNDKLKMDQRSSLILCWKEKNGILIIGYEQYRCLSNNEKLSVRMLFNALIKAHVLICDEGHRIKNDKSDINIALHAIETKNRIILTGFPIQNHLKEYFCMVEFVRPKFFKNYKKFEDFFVKPIESGKYIDSTCYEKHLMLQRAYILHELLLPFVQRRCNLLEISLKGKFDLVIPLGITTFQEKLLHEFDQTNGEKNVFAMFATCLNICNHPDVLRNSIKNPPSPGAHQMTQNYNPIDGSPKMQLFFLILEESMKLEDRLLVFSQSLGTLDVIENILQNKTDNAISWKKNVNYYRMDGKTTGKQRNDLVNDFNSNTKVHLFLISTKAGCMGVNLVGANRLIGSCKSSVHLSYLSVIANNCLLTGF